MRRHKTFRMPRAVQVVADRLMTTPGLIGVYWGTPLDRRGQSGEPELIVHVDGKQPVPRSIDLLPVTVRVRNVRVSMMDVPLAGQHVVGCGVPVRGDDEARGRSTITAIALVDGVPHLIVSGHGTLPMIDGDLPGLYEGEVPAGVVSDGGELGGSLNSGRLDATSDFAIAMMRGTEDDVDLFHDVAQAFTPIPVRC